jgi:hypothetical protein
MNKLQIKFLNQSRGFCPGEVLQGQVQWELAEPAKRVEVRLFWATSGTGVAETGVASTIQFDHCANQDTRPFNFQLPAFPFSYQGCLMSLDWAVEAICTPGNVTAREEFILGPERKKVLLHPTDASSASSLFHLKPAV